MVVWCHPAFDVVLGLICCGWGVDENQLNLSNFEAFSPQAAHNINQFPAHPYHHLLIGPVDDNQWLCGCHPAGGGCAALDLWLEC
jgi:hypothetical protein